MVKGWPSKARVPELMLLSMTAVAYFGFASRTVQGADSGEFATLLAVGGVAHPPGYPFYVELLRLMRWLPASSYAHAASLVTALLGVASSAMWSVAARAWGASRWSSLGAVGLISFSPLVWAASTEPEVFIGNALLAGVLVFAAAPFNTRTTGWRRAALTALTLGLGASNQHTLALLTPLAIWALVLALRESRSVSKVIAPSATAFGVGLLPYAGVLLAWRQGSGLIWGGPASLDALVHHVLRVDYGTFQLARSSEAAHATDLLLFFFVTLSRNTLWAPPVLMLLIRPRDAHQRWPWLAFALSWLLAGPAFAAMANIAPIDLGARIVERFTVLPLVMLSVPIALAFDSVFTARERLGTLVQSALVLLAIMLTAPQIAAIRRATVETYLRDALTVLPKGAVLLTDGDVLFHGFTYLLLAEHVRDDVTLISPNTLRFDWYRAPLEAATHQALPREASAQNIEALVRSFQRNQRAVFLTDPGNMALSASLAVAPEGTLWRVLKPDEKSPGPLTLLEKNRQLYSRFSYDEPSALHEGTWGFDMQRRYASTWKTLAQALEEGHHPEAAAQARLVMRNFTH